MAEVELAHTDDRKHRRAQNMNSAPVLTPFQHGTPAAVYAYSRKDAQGYWSVQDLNTCSHGYTNKLGEARCRTCKEIVNATGAELVLGLVYAEQQK